MFRTYCWVLHAGGGSGLSCPIAAMATRRKLGTACVVTSSSQDPKIFWLTESPYHRAGSRCLIQSSFLKSAVLATLKAVKRERSRQIHSPVALLVQRKILVKLPDILISHLDLSIVGPSPKMRSWVKSTTP